MSVTWWMFLAGLVLGGSAGFFVACLMMVARDERIIEEFNRMREEEKDAKKHV